MAFVTQLFIGTNEVGSLGEADEVALRALIEQHKGDAKQKYE